MESPQRGASTEVASPLGAKSNCESQSGNSEDSEIAFDNSGRLKVVAAAALAGISYDFGQLKIMKIQLGSMESYTHYFTKGHGRPLDVESIPEPQANEAVIFEDFFTAGLCMPPHPVLVDILRKFHIQLHQLTPNAIIQIGKFIWAVTSYGGHPTTDVVAQHYEMHYQNKIHLVGCETTLVAQFDCITFHPSCFER
jgi:hypothetical protein